MDRSRHPAQRSDRLADLGIAPHVIESVLNHKRGGIAGVYNRGRYETEKRNALALWADHVCEIVTGVKSNVTPLRSSQIPVRGLI